MPPSQHAPIVPDHQHSATHKASRPGVPKTRVRKRSAHGGLTAPPRPCLAPKATLQHTLRHPSQVQAPQQLAHSPQPTAHTFLPCFQRQSVHSLKRAHPSQVRGPRLVPHRPRMPLPCPLPLALGDILRKLPTTTAPPPPPPPPPLPPPLPPAANDARSPPAPPLLP